jgi:uncharacterized protein (DUF2132 family)
MDVQKNNPLHGQTLQSILEYLVETYGWEELSVQIDINCFKNEPSFCAKHLGPDKKWKVFTSMP